MRVADREDEKPCCKFCIKENNLQWREAVDAELTLEVSRLKSELNTAQKKIQELEGVIERMKQESPWRNLGGTF